LLGTLAVVIVTDRIYSELVSDAGISKSNLSLVATLEHSNYKVVLKLFQPMCDLSSAVIGYYTRICDVGKIIVYDTIVIANLKREKIWIANKCIYLNLSLRCTVKKGLTASTHHPN